MHNRGQTRAAPRGARRRHSPLWALTPAPHRPRAALGALAALLLASSVGTGCATAAEQWKGEARYSPSVRGYVLDAQDKKDAPRLLLHPITREKFRCADDLERWKLALAEEMEVEEQLDAVQLATVLIVAPVALPLSILSAPLMAVGMAAQVPSAYWRFTRAAAHGSLGSVQRALDEGEYRVAIGRLHQLLADDSEVATSTRALYWLGLAYHELGEQEEARKHLMAFLQRAHLQDLDAYEEVEALLGEHQPNACAQGAVRFPWARPVRERDRGGAIPASIITGQP